MSDRVRVAKAYKMFVNGAFVRSESGRYFQVGSIGEHGADPERVNIPRASRKDARDAVVAAKGAQEGWAKRTAYNRGQILYRLAEVVESRRAELVASLARGGEAESAREVDCAVDRAVYYAGFCDKFQALMASSNPVAGPHFGFSVPEPMGVVAILAPARPALLGLLSTTLPVIAGGNTCVVVAGDADPRTAVLLGECLATSDLPGGVINILLGYAKEVGPHLAKHREVIAMDVWSGDPDLVASLERDGATNVKRIRARVPSGEALYGERSGQGIGWIEAFLETKTVWHPVGV